MDYVLAIDQGTSGSKAIIFGADGTIAASATTALSSLFFNEGFVEQNPEDIYTSVLTATESAIARFIADGHHKEDIIAAGISNQRESFVLWDRTGTPLTNVVVWQCKRSVSICEQMKQEGLETTIRDKSGLMIDPYFSGTKVTWLLEHDPELKQKCNAGMVFFGTIDTWLLYRLTDKKIYITDYTNASRTLFCNLDTLSWDKELLDLFGAKNLNLPQIHSSSGYLGKSTFGSLFPNGLQICSIIGDSQSASFGEGCLLPGTVKATMGTGSSVLLNTGSQRIRSSNGMVSTVCWSAGNRIDYALEGIIVSCGSTVNWIQNQLGLVTSGKEYDILAESVSDSGGVTFLPAFSGLGGPYWQMDRKAEITGITFGTTKAHIVRAALESYPFQLKSIIAAMENDTGIPVRQIYADGGMTDSKLTMRYIADLLHTSVVINRRKEASAFGAALLAFFSCNILSLDTIGSLCSGSAHRTYEPTSDDEDTYIKRNYEKWLAVVNKG